MSEDEKLRAIGQDIQDLREAKGNLACLNTKTRKMIEGLTKAINVLKRNATGHYVEGAFYIHAQPHSGVPHGQVTFPAADEFATLLKEREQTQEGVSELSSKLKDVLAT